MPNAESDEPISTPPARARRILLLSMKAGAGHIRAAQAIEAALHARHPHCEVRHLETLEFAAPLIRRGFNAVYFPMIRWAPSLWRRIYEHTESSSNSAAHNIGWAVNRLGLRRLRREILAFDPHCIVSTHFFPAQVAAALKRAGRLNAELNVVLTDYAVHGMWIHSGTDRYFAATESMAAQLRERTSAEVVASGIPISAAFSTCDPDKRRVRQSLGLEEESPTLLATSGGGGLGSLEATVQCLAVEFPNLRILAVAGHNAAGLTALRGLARRHPKVVPFGFVSNMHELMAASDWAITKPGGLTCSECLAMDLPMLLVDPIPGQEERNAAYLQTCGAALHVRTPALMIDAIRRLLDHPGEAERMRIAARAAAHPDAANTVADCTALQRQEAIGGRTSCEKSFSA